MDAVAQYVHQDRTTHRPRQGGREQRARGTQAPGPDSERHRDSLFEQRDYQ
ncbi:hypothetical protein Ae706Ps2_5277c [Pseudonocardia sp. Ae706_Ps2]|nr:hypothetical protein Ae505Ps2_0030 [Pseudonocardia sp. Ae505_Ps2]OLM26844.1 hypothetical protein Ae706Ps2_5277c [Pseudonocardia sp. Ae706_Ps2]